MVYGPCHGHVEAAPLCVFQHSVEAGPLVAPLGTADAVVAVDLRHRPAPPLSDLPQFAGLVFDRLPVRR